MTDQERQEIKHDRDRLVHLLEQDGHVIPETGKFLCKYHPDRNPSAEVRETPGGFYFVCYGCDKHFDFFALTAFRENRSVNDVLRDQSIESAADYLSAAPQQQKPQSSIQSLIDWYISKHPTHQCTEQNFYTESFATLRFEGPNGKEIKPAMIKEHGWAWGRPIGDPLPLFNLEKVTAAHGVLVVEGEKCVRAFEALEIEGWAATTSQGGSHDVRHADLTPLIGKDIVLWRDFDAAGKYYEENIIERLLSPTQVIRKIQINELGLEEGEDIADYLETVGDPEERRASVAALLGDAQIHRPSEALHEQNAKILSGEYQLIPFPILPKITVFTQALLPGAITLICGPPGSAKSWLAMELGWTLEEEGVAAETLFMEKTAVDYQTRCTAQMAGRPEFLNLEWRQNSFETAREIINSVQDRIDAYFRRVRCDQFITADGFIQWLEKSAKKGARVLIADPITARQQSAKPWIDDQKFIAESQRIAGEYGISLVYTLHPRGGKAGAMGLDGMAGGMALTRFCDTGLWIEVNKGGRSLSPIEGEGTEGFTSVSHSRKITIVKSRNSTGEWKNLAVDLDPVTLRFREFGVIMSPQAAEDAILNETQF
jgi:hypothetical protein